MKYYSLQHQSPAVDFRQASIQGQAPDKGLYFPQTIPVFDGHLIRDIDSLTNEEIAFQVIRPYVGDSIPELTLREIIRETLCFEIPLVKISPRIYALELFHGPTLAFKDMGARFMSRCLGYFSRGHKNKLTVLVATSGDTGGAVANGFFGVEGVEVVILYPSGKVSQVQEKQLTTLGSNIRALEVLGNFDDCQQLVKQAFADPQLQQALHLTSANSINIARWLPQQFYYLFAWKQWKDKTRPPVISVPSGNFGNICAGLLAHQSGLPVAHFIAACNQNDVVPDFLETGKYQPKKAVATISNAMDVGDPSNFIRILELFSHQLGHIRKTLSGTRVTDEQTRQTILQVHKQFGYLLDPHGAVGYQALDQYLSARPEQEGIVLETAHPVKFLDVVEPVTGQAVPIPEAVASILQKEKKSLVLPVDYTAFKSFLLDN